MMSHTWLPNLLPAGDTWYFPANLPHSFVGLEPHGCQFVSGYKSPNFDELQAFSASTWLATIPVDTLAQVASFPRYIYDTLHIYVSDIYAFCQRVHTHVCEWGHAQSCTTIYSPFQCILV